jgi:acyl-CoA synthetase (AMP-forming)/AMP-acid ligase II
VNLALVLDMAADGYGDRAAFGSRQDGLSYVRLRALAAAAGVWAEKDGASTLALAGPTGPAVPVALFGAARAGITYAPLNYRLPAERLAALVGRLDRPLFIAGRDVLAGRRVDEAVVDEDWLAGLDAATDAMADVEPRYADDPDRPAVLLFTSGSTAEPKAALLQHDHLCSYVFNTSEFGSAEPEEAVLIAVPPFHVAGVAAIISACYTGRRIVALPTFSPEDWLDTARNEEITHAFVVPTMLARIVAAAEADPDTKLPHLRSLAYGGARMPAPVLERALRLFPGTGFVNAYGLTETSSTVAVLSPDDHRQAIESEDTAGRGRLSSVGRPVAGIEVAITTETGEPASAECPGQIRLRGPQVSGAYAGEGSQLDGDGWLATGDLGWQDPDGYLYIVGRADDVIIRGGENISPSEVEDTLLRHPSVAQAAVVGLPDTEWGERIAAMVVLRPGAATNGEELFRWAQNYLGTLKAPQLVVLRSELPTTPTGKILRRQIRAELTGSGR